jgi:hypothetical protein
MTQNWLFFSYGVAVIAIARKVIDALVRVFKWRDELYWVKRAIAVMPHHWLNCLFVGQVDS